MITTEKVIYLKVSGEKHIIWLRALKNWRVPTQLIIFPYFGAKILRIAHLVNYSYLPPCLLTYREKRGKGKYGKGVKIKNKRRNIVKGKVEN